MYYSDDRVDYDYSSPVAYKALNVELRNFGHRLDTPPSPSIPTPPTPRLSAAVLPRREGLDVTLSPGLDINRLLTFDDLLVDFKEEGK